MMSQLILNLDTSDNGVYYNGESVCIASCLPKDRDKQDRPRSDCF